MEKRDGRKRCEGGRKEGRDGRKEWRKELRSEGVREWRMEDVKERRKEWRRQWAGGRADDRGRLQVKPLLGEVAQGPYEDHRTRVVRDEKIVGVHVPMRVHGYLCVGCVTELDAGDRCDGSWISEMKGRMWWVGCLKCNVIFWMLRFECDGFGCVMGSDVMGLGFRRWRVGCDSSNVSSLMWCFGCKGLDAMIRGVVFGRDDLGGMGRIFQA